MDHVLFSDHLFSLIQNRNHVSLLFQIFLSYLDENVDSLYQCFSVALHLLAQNLPVLFKFRQNFRLTRLEIRLIGCSKSIEKMTCRFVECSQRQKYLNKGYLSHKIGCIGHSLGKDSTSLKIYLCLFIFLQNCVACSQSFVDKVLQSIRSQPRANLVAPVKILYRLCRILNRE